jgi:hypothetical protein
MDDDDNKPLWHWEYFYCEITIPNDVVTSRQSEVTCPECRQKLEQVKRRRSG